MVVLVHGAWADESSWDEVRVQLRRIVGRTVTVSLPLSSLADDVAALDAALAAIDGPVVLVGHAYAGAVIGATRSDKVTALVYVTALAPDEGETVAEVFYRDERDDTAPALAPDDEGWIRLPADAFETAFAQHAPGDRQQNLAAAQRPINAACITVPVGRPLWHSIPAWYLVAEQDHMIPEKTQRFLAARMNARISSYPVDHLPSVTAPAVVTAVIAEAVRTTAE
jgi:pimeloyl-ACP methyl ester carboxylesterase